MTTQKNIYAVLDVKCNLYGNPIFQASDGVAIRAFGTACEDEKTELNKYPSDFSLYRIGTYDIESGEIKGQTPTQIANASEFVNKQ